MLTQFACRHTAGSLCSLTVGRVHAAEKQVLRDQAKTAGGGGKPKPANIIDKIISGRINKVCCHAMAVTECCWQWISGVCVGLPNAYVGGGFGRPQFATVVQCTITTGLSLI